MEKDLTENKLEEDKDHALKSAVVQDNRIKVSEDMRLWRESI